MTHAAADVGTMERSTEERCEVTGARLPWIEERRARDLKQVPAVVSGSGQRDLLHKCQPAASEVADEDQKRRKDGDCEEDEKGRVAMPRELLQAIITRSARKPAPRAGFLAF